MSYKKWLLKPHSSVKKVDAVWVEGWGAADQVKKIGLVKRQSS